MSTCSLSEALRNKCDYQHTLSPEKLYLRKWKSTNWRGDQYSKKHSRCQSYEYSVPVSSPLSLWLATQMRNCLPISQEAVPVAKCKHPPHRCQFQILLLKHRFLVIKNLTRVKQYSILIRNGFTTDHLHILVVYTSQTSLNQTMVISEKEKGFKQRQTQNGQNERQSSGNNFQRIKHIHSRIYVSSLTCSSDYLTASNSEFWIKSRSRKVYPWPHIWMVALCFSYRQLAQSRRV